MTILVNTLYTIFLGMMFRNLVLVELLAGGASRQIQVHALLRSDNALRTVPLLILFGVDWICFQIVFPPLSAASFSTADAVLLIAYVPVLVALGYAVVLSLEKSSRFTAPAAYYHILAACAEIIWLAVGIVQLPEKGDGIPPHTVAILLTAMLFYVLIRFLLAICYLAIRWDRAGPVRPEVLPFIGLALKPALFVFLAKSLDVALIL